MRKLLIAYVLANALLYSTLLPLWEGFDEPFHYGYVQYLANGFGLPDPTKAMLSREIAASLTLAPASNVVRQNLPQVTTYGEYHSFPPAKRAALRRGLHDLPAPLRWQASEILNYEAHQPPLAYALLAIPDRLLANVPLLPRIAILRILAALAGAILLLLAAERIYPYIISDNNYYYSVLFCLFSAQMLWATVAHVANDWLAIPLGAWVLAAMLKYSARQTLSTASAAALFLAAALLTKAYFLAFVPLLLSLCVIRRQWRHLLPVAAILVCLAGPWYIRNVVRFGTLAGTQEARSGVSASQVVANLPALDWPTAVFQSIHSAVWTGNNTFSTFSANTINIFLIVGALGLLCWAAGRHTASDILCFTYCAIFVAALAYATVVSHIFTHGMATQPSPWYAQLIVAPLWGLIFAGASRFRKGGKYIAACAVVLSGYILVLTYFAKLVPLYAGWDGRASLPQVVKLYATGWRALSARLGTASLAPGAVLLPLCGVVAVLAVWQLYGLLKGIAGGPAPVSPSRSTDVPVRAGR